MQKSPSPPADKPRMHQKPALQRVTGAKQLQRVTSKFQSLLAQKAEEMPSLDEHPGAHEFLTAKQAEYVSNLKRLERQITDYQREREEHMDELEKLRRRLNARSDSSGELVSLQTELQNLRAVDRENLARLSERDSEVARLRSLVDEYNRERAQFVSAEEVSRLRAEEEARRLGVERALSAREAELSALRAKYNALQSSAQEEQKALGEALASKAREVAALLATIRELEYRIQDLRGKIRICLRLRPAAASLSADFPDEASYKKQMVYKTEGLRDVTGREQNRTVPLQFDRVFTPGASQDDVFEEILPLVRQVQDGFKTCVFAYGQSGSGKTHTQYGSIAERGLMPRAIEYLLNAGSALRVSFYEIYNDKIFDLLADYSPETNNLLSSAVEPQQAKAKSYEPVQRRVSITAERVQIPGLAIAEVSTPEEAARLIAVSQARRKTSQTVLNDVSSRSHAVFTISLAAEKQSGSLTIVDLAGSEQLNGEQVDAQRREESVCINRSLATLSTVFCALKTGASHVPFRDSTLTKVLQEYFTGQNKVVLIACINADISCYQESVNTINFAQRLRAVTVPKK